LLSSEQTKIMPKDLTETLLLKRSSKTKSGYSVSEEDSGYYVGETPSKARVSPGDRVVGINGIPADEFLAEEDANGLIESIRIVVGPKEKLDEYDIMHQGDDIVEDDEEGYEEYDRSRSAKPKPRNERVIPRNERVIPRNEKVIHCDHCNYENVNLEPDEDDDLVCEDCGHVIDPPSGGDNNIYKCMHCDHLNEDLEPDEDGDLVCQGCGHVMEPDVIHCCERCDHENKNLERDDEGDLVCQECGHVIPEESREVRSVVPIYVHDICL
jgi:DNA-directed RNA polymerase subunit RPC12/RpoP